MIDERTHFDPTMGLDDVAEQLGRILQRKGGRLVTAESCTAGGIGYWVTSVAGSSNWFDRGFITYSNESKIEMLGVSPRTLDEYGAVSGPVVDAMAGGALKHSRADVAVAVSGIAGPGGGSTEKPVGLVWFGWAERGRQASYIKSFRFDGDRDWVRKQAISIAMQGVITMVSESGTQ